jgi:peptide/nickel transport system permease protein
MGTYVLRRLLLMVPTLLGISFLFFMLIALSPGGVGAALRVAGGGATEATNRAVQEAYLEDRYGLDDPVVVQYLRWLGRISPVKFGARDQIGADGAPIRRPAAVKRPALWRWFAEELPGEPGVLREELWAADASEQDMRLAFQRATDADAQARQTFVAAKANFRQEAGFYMRSRAIARTDLVSAKGDPREDRLRAWTPDRDVPEWAKVAEAGARMMEAHAQAQASRARLRAMFDERPMQQAGFPIVPGLVWVGWPDLGRSFAKGQPVSAIIADRLPVTLMLNMLAFPIIYVVAVPLGVMAANRRGSWVDNTIGVGAVALWSIPVPWAGVMCIGFLCANEYLGWFPVAGLSSSGAEKMTFLPSWHEGAFERGFLVDRLWHMALPVLCLVYAGFAVLSKQTRAAMLDNFNADYVRTAKAKGCSWPTIVLAHVFRNSLLPLITMFAAVFPAMLAGSVVVESIFTINGMGSMILEAISLKDREILLANAVMIALVNMLALLMADVLYAAADPRVSYG